MGRYIQRFPKSFPPSPKATKSSKVKFQLASIFSNPTAFNEIMVTKEALKECGYEDLTARMLAWKQPFIQRVRNSSLVEGPGKSFNPLVV